MMNRTGHVCHHARRPGALLGAMLTTATFLGACGAERLEPIACDVEPYLLPVEGLSVPEAAVAASEEGLPTSDYERAVLQSLRRASEAPAPAGDRDVAVAPKTLALSGGGPWGAYGAGFLKAWNDELGEFPPFATVTGVSTGALQATFAFLGGDNLDRLDALYRNVENRDIFDGRNTLHALLRHNAFNSLDPLRRLIRDEIVTNGWLDEVRAEAGLGRKLFVGIVDLDSGTLFAADLTAVASDGDLSAEATLTCYTELLVASAAVPVAFDPVATESGAAPPRRLLVDGGVRAAAFIESSERALNALLAERRRETDLQFDGETVVVINGTLEMCPQVTPGGILSIGKRSVSALIHQNNLNSLSNILFRRTKDGQCARYTYVNFTSDLCSVDADTTSFDPEFMNLLADRGRGRWQTDDPFESVGACNSRSQ